MLRTGAQVKGVEYTGERLKKEKPPKRRLF